MLSKVSRRLVIWICVLLHVGSVCGKDHERCSRTSFYLRPNHTWCPNTCRVSDFTKYGFQADSVPRDLSSFRPNLLHERSVIHHVDTNKAFVQVGSGHEGVVYRAEIRDSSTPVIVKTLKDKTFHQIYHEAQILTYLNDVTSVPRLVGLLPTGAERNNLSIVSEYVKNSSTLGLWFNNSHKVSQCQWLNISHQIASTLRSVNEKHVLHNDLHHKNILVQWIGSLPKVYFIDFGDSTFRHGRAVKNFNPYNNKFHQLYLPPEVSFDQSTPASDIYSLGQNLRTIAHLSKIRELDVMSSQCIAKDPDLRMPVKVLEKQLHLLLKSSCSADPPGHADSLRKEIPTPFYDMRKSFHHLPLPILSSSDFTQFKSSMFSEFQSAYHLPTGNSVVIQRFPHASFEYIRHCARVNLYLNDTSYVPLFMGIVFTGSRMSDIALVQRAVPDSLSLSNIVHNMATLSEFKRVDLLREIANALLVFNQRHIGCRQLYTEDILINFENNKPRVIFIHFGRMRYGGNPEKKYSEIKKMPVSVRKKSPRYYNRMRFSEIVQRLLPEFHYRPYHEMTMNFSSIISMDISPVSDWVFLSN